MYFLVCSSFGKGFHTLSISDLERPEIKARNWLYEYNYKQTNFEKGGGDNI